MQRSRARWSLEAACAGEPTDLFTEKQTKNIVKMLRELCSECPVIQECRKYALVHEKNGFWAGLTQFELKKLRSQVLSTLGYEAYSEGWLEPDSNLVSPQMLFEFSEIAKMKPGTQKFQALRGLQEVQKIPDLSEIQIGA